MITRAQASRCSAQFVVNFEILQSRHVTFSAMMVTTLNVLLSTGRQADDQDISGGHNIFPWMGNEKIFQKAVLWSATINLHGEEVS